MYQQFQKQVTKHPETGDNNLINNRHSLQQTKEQRAALAKKQKRPHQTSKHNVDARTYTRTDTYTRPPSPHVQGQIPANPRGSSTQQRARIRVNGFRFELVSQCLRSSWSRIELWPLARARATNALMGGGFYPWRMPVGPSDGPQWFP